MRLATTSLVTALLLGIAGCGGDNLSLCDGCKTPTPTPTVTTTPVSTATGAVTPGPTPTPTL